MKKLVLLLGIILYLVSCKVEEPKFANQSTFLREETLRALVNQYKA